MATYTPQQQAEISRRYPGIEWVNGQPYTRQQSRTPEIGEVDYLGRPVDPDTSDTLVPAHTTNQNFPWEFFVAQAAAPFLVAGGQAGVGALSGGGGGAAAGTGAATTTAGTGVGVGAGTAGVGAGTAGVGAGATGIGAGAGATTAGTAAGGGGFLSTLGTIAPYAAGAGRVLGGAAEASAQNQLERQQLEQNRTSQAVNLFGAQQGAQMQQGQLDLQRQEFQAKEEGSRLRRALLGQLLGNAQALDIDIPGIQKPKITGGLSVNSLGQGGRDIGAEMTARALMQLRAKPTYEGGQILQSPNIPDIGKTGGNGFLNALGTIGSLIGGIGSIGGQRQQPGVTPPGTITGTLPSDFRF